MKKTVVYTWAAELPPEKFTRNRKGVVDPKKAKTACLKQRFSSASKARSLFINPKTGKHFAKSTMCRALQKAGCRSKRVKRMPKLTQEHKERRVAFCDEHEDEH